MSTAAPTITTRIAVPARDKVDSPHAGDAMKIAVRHLNFYYGKSQALYDVSLEIPERIVMAFERNVVQRL